MRAYVEMESLRDEGIAGQIANINAVRMLDLGCGEGQRTKKWADAATPKQVVAVDRSMLGAKHAKMLGFDAVVADLNAKLPFADNSFDLVISNQVIEHLFDLDNFVSEIRRVGSEASKVVVSTENLSAWENIFALVLGYRPFSCEDSRKSTGNPFSLQRYGDDLGLHVKVLTFNSLRELFAAHGIRVEKTFGSGMVFLLWKPVMKIASLIDPIHCRFITVVGQLQKRLDRP